MSPEGASERGGGPGARARRLLDGIVERVARAGGGAFGLVATADGDAVALSARGRVVARLSPSRGDVFVDVDPRSGAGNPSALRRLGSPHPDRTRSAAGWRRVVVRTHADAARAVHAPRSPRGEEGDAPRPQTTGLLVRRVRVRRLGAPPSPDDGTRVFVDPSWPHGVRREESRVDLWLPAVAPSTPVREAFGVVPVGRRGFRRAYLAELRGGPRAELVARLRRILRQGPLTLLTALREVEHSAAVVLADVVSRGRTPKG